MNCKPYIVKFNHFFEGERGQQNTEEMFLCLHAENIMDAREKYLTVTGGPFHQNWLVSITDERKIEFFWMAVEHKFVTIPKD